MRIHQPAPGVLQLSRLRHFSCHLFAGPDGVTLIDTGLPGSADAILAAAQNLNQPIRHVLITHGHQDHCGSLDRLTERLPDAEVVMSARTQRLIAGDRTPLPEDEGRPLRGGYATCRTRPTRLALADERIGGFRVLATPGHAVDHVSYLHEATGFLFTGDALHTAGGRLAVSGEFRALFPFPYFATWDRALALESARMIAALQPKGLLPAHGPAVLDPARPLEKAIDHAARAFDRRSAA